ncbi:MAG TPA: hypothetical protein VGD53_07545 [Actinoallomurus sp.]|jgi:hypothetical protein
MESESKGRNDQQASEESGDQHPQGKTAAELSNRAAESVGRRYDGTKEAFQEPNGEDHGDTEEQPGS